MHTVANRAKRYAKATINKITGPGSSIFCPGNVPLLLRSRLRRPKMVPTTQRPAGPPKKIQEPHQFHQLAIAHSSAKEAESARGTRLKRAPITGAVAMSTDTGVTMQRRINTG